MNIKNLSPSDWMSALPGSMPITQVNMPGSHDGAMCRGSIFPKQKTRSIGFAPARFAADAFSFVVDGIANPITLCQSDFISGQLEMGVRVFDIRIDYKGDEKNIDTDALLVFHGPSHALDENGDILSFKKILECCKAFLAEHKSEAAVILYNVENDKRDLQYTGEGGRLWNKVIDKLLTDLSGDDNVIVLKKGSKVPCVEQCRGKIILLDAARDVLKFEDDYEAKYNEKIQILENVFSMNDPQKTDCDLSVDTRYESPEPKLIFTNCYWGPDLKKYVKPKALAMAFSALVSLFYLQKPQAKHINRFILGHSFKNGNRCGWVMLNFATQQLCSAIYCSNKTE